MTKLRAFSGKIPAVLSLPEQISAFVKRLLKIRLPLRRSFSGPEAVCPLAAGLLLLLSVLIRPLRNYQMIVCIIAVAACLYPLGMNAWRSIRAWTVPVEEITIAAALALALILRSWSAAALLAVFSALLQQVQGYALLHRDAELEAFEAGDPVRKKLETCSAEASRHGAAVLSGALGVYVLFLLLAVIYAILAAVHHTDASPWLTRVMLLLGLASPATAVYSAGLLHFGTFCSAAKAGIFFHDDRVPEEYRKCRIFAFSKTGTVTDGKYVISEIAPVGVSREDLLKIAAIGECRSEHPIARALKQTAGLREGAEPEGLQSSEEIPGKGVSTLFAGHQIYVGNAGLLEEHGIWYSVPARTGSAIHVAMDNSYRGYIMISDQVRDNAFDALEELRAAGANTLVMLTGDVRSAARQLASSLNFDMVKPELSPAEKGSAVRYLRSVHGESARIACAGDGVHDEEMFYESDISICMRAHEDTEAEVSIRSDDIEDIPRSFRICRTAEKMLLICLLAFILVKVLLCVLGLASVLAAPLIFAIDGLIGSAITIWCLTSFRME